MPAPEPSLSGRPLTLLMVAGEPSGDAHGADLIEALKAQRPSVRIIGVGGQKMLAAGQDQLFDLASHAVLGLMEVLKQYFKFRGFRNRILDLARREQPDAVVLIDCSGFNLRLAPHLRQSLPYSKIIYYISPQVWASRARRVEKMQRDLDLVISILPFEKEWFAQRAPALRVHWVGHPLVDRIHTAHREEIDPNQVVLLPGSRRTEIQSHLPVLWETARLMSRQRPDLKFVLLSPNETMQRFALDLINQLPTVTFAFASHIGQARAHLSRSALALVASGTASLECALVGIPQIVIYRVHPLTYAVGKRVIKVNYLSLINVMADERIVPEFIQDALQPAAVAQEALGLLDNPERRAAMQTRIAQIVATLGDPGASHRAAQTILSEAVSTKGS